jgi:hypothetical protein
MFTVTATQEPPPGAGESGRALWSAILTEYTLDQHEIALLREAARTADICDELQRIVDLGGVMIAVDDGQPVLNRALVELRQQRITLGRLLVALRIPLGDDADKAPTGTPRLQRRPIRGFYSKGAAS